MSLTGNAVTDFKEAGYRQNSGNPRGNDLKSGDISYDLTS